MVQLQLAETCVCHSFEDAPESRMATHHTRLRAKLARVVTASHTNGEVERSTPTVISFLLDNAPKREPIFAVITYPLVPTSLALQWIYFYIPAERRRCHLPASIDKPKSRPFLLSFKTMTHRHLSIIPLALPPSVLGWPAKGDAEYPLVGGVIEAGGHI